MKTGIAITSAFFVSLLLCSAGCEDPSTVAEQPVPAQTEQHILLATPVVAANVHDNSLPPTPFELNVVYPDVIRLYWGDGDGEVGLLPPVEERIPQGPLSLAADNDGSLWVLDQVNERLVHLSPHGEWLGSMMSPPGATDLYVGPDGRLFVLSLINHRVTVLDALGTSEHVQIPMAFHQIAGIFVEARGHLLLTTAYENTYDLGAPGAWIPWPDVLHSAGEGLPGASGGPRFRPLLHQDRAALVHRTSPETPFETWVLPDTEGAASVALLDSKVDGSVVVLLEWLREDGVERVVRWVDPDAGIVDEIELAPSPFTYPFREIAVGPTGVLHRLYSEPDGLIIENYELRRAE